MNYITQCHSQSGARVKSVW